jgi:hypothetical protein
MFDPDKFQCDIRIRDVNNTLRWIDEETLFATDSKFSEIDASSYIEQFLCRIAVDYIKCIELGESYICYDGNTRLNALNDYVNDKFALSELKIFDHLNGLKYSELSRRYQRRITESDLNFFQIRFYTLSTYKQAVIDKA